MWKKCGEKSQEPSDTTNSDRGDSSNKKPEWLGDRGSKTFTGIKDKPSGL